MPTPANPSAQTIARPEIVHATCATLPPVGRDTRDQLECIEMGRHGAAPGARDSLRVVFWNAERGHAPEQAGDLLAETSVDVALLCELDNGIARTGRRHVTQDIARRLGADFIYAVEFIEMESREAGDPGFHGNAIVSHIGMSTPMLVRLGDAQRWQSGEGRARRTGDRIALATRVMIDDSPVVMVTTHLESHAPPGVRASQMRILLDAIDGYAAGDPVLIGGDFNTRTAAKDDLREPAARTRLHQDFPALFARPAPREPLFAVAEAAGYDWLSCNTSAPTERSRNAAIDMPRFRLDWFFARGLVCENPAVVSAESTHGKTLSDHDAITVEVRHRRTGA